MLTSVFRFNKFFWKNIQALLTCVLLLESFETAKHKWARARMFFQKNLLKFPEISVSSLKWIAQAGGGGEEHCTSELHRRGRPASLPVSYIIWTNKQKQSHLNNFLTTISTIIITIIIGMPWQDLWGWCRRRADHPVWPTVDEVNNKRPPGETRFIWNQLLCITRRLLESAIGIFVEICHVVHQLRLVSSIL